MKRVISIIFLLFPIFGWDVMGAEIETREMKLFREGGKVVVSFSAFVPENTVRADRRLVIIPQLYNDKGSVSTEAFVVSGRRFDRRNKQKRLLKSNFAYTEYTGTGNGSTMSYVAAVEYESWMGHTLNLRFDIVEEGCCSTSLVGLFTHAKPMELSLPYAPSLPLVKPHLSEPAKMATMYPFLTLAGTEEQSDRTVSVRFRLASAILDPSFSSNAGNLDKIMQGIRLVQSDPRTRLEKISIVGFASPDGDSHHNMKFAENRALALSTYLQGKMTLPSSLFEARSGGEDWTTLLELVRESDMRYKDEVIDIITRYPAEERTLMLKELDGGRPYRGMQDILYPQLRDACYINVWYSETGDEAAEVINNAIGIIAMLRYDEALSALDAVKYDTRSWNVIGTCHLLKGDYDQARVWLEKAAEAGDKEALKNLELIN